MNSGRKSPTRLDNLPGPLSAFIGRTTEIAEHLDERFQLGTGCQRTGNHRHNTLEATPDWIVDDYFETGQRVTSWMGGEVNKYLRTVEDYFLALIANGFHVEALRESHPRRALFMDEATYQRRKRIPLLQFLAAQRFQSGEIKG
jgi:hypothetical protein